MRGHRGRYPLLADEDLISLVGAGDAFAFTVLHDRYSRAIYSLARRLTVDEQDVEDLAQDAFLKVWRSADSYRAERGSVRTFFDARVICKLLHHVFLDARQLGAHPTLRVGETNERGK